MDINNLFMNFSAIRTIGCVDFLLCIIFLNSMRVRMQLPLGGLKMATVIAGYMEKILVLF